MSKIDINKLKLTEDQTEIYKEAMLSLANHNQAAIHLVTSGGKSYILAEILHTLKEAKRGKRLNVIYISTPGSCTNFLECMSDDYWGDTLTVINYTQLQRDEKYVDRVFNKKCDIIVIDEAHCALAKETYKGIVYIQNKYNTAGIIAMSANNKRYDDKKWVFSWLTPKLIYGVDYHDRGLKHAIANDKICNFSYKCCDIDTLKRYCDIFSTLQNNSKYFYDADKLILKAQNIIEEYKNNAFSKLAIQMHKDLHNHGINGKQGDRWFVFFNRIDELKESVEAIRNMYIKAYDNDKLTINFYEYHNANHDAAEIEECLTGKANENTVDVILTCLKGTMSFHPENTRGIIMNRRSGSENLITQMLGRPLQIKELCDDCKLIYDLVGNNETLDITQSIFNGSEAPEDRDILSALGTSNSSDKLMELLENQYGNVGDYSTIEDESLEDLLSRFEEHKDKVEKIIYAQIIADIFKQYEVEHGDASQHPYVILNAVDKESNTKGKFNLTEAFKTIQKMFIQGYFGEHYMNDVDNKTDDFFEIYRLLGDKLYLTANCMGKATWKDDDYSVQPPIKLSELREIAEEIRSYNYNYKTSISHTKVLNSKISRLRQLNLDGRLSESYQKYCKRNRIDIDGSYVNIINVVLTSPEAKKNESLTREFKSLVRYMTAIEVEIENSKSIEDELKEKIIIAIAKQVVFSERYGKREFGKQATLAINLRFKDIIVLRRNYIDKNDYMHARKDAIAVTKVLIQRNSTDESKLNISGEHEIYIMALSKRNETGKIGYFESLVLDEIGIKEFRGTRDKDIRELIEVTEFNKLYNQFITTGSAQAYAKLQNYKIDDMPEYCKKRLRTRQFKQSTEEVKQSRLLLKDCTQIRDIVSELIYPDEDKVRQLKELIKTKEFDTRNLIKYAIPEKTYIQNRAYFDQAIANNWEHVEDDKRKAIVNILSRDTSCIGIIVENLCNAGLVPEVQKEFTQIIIKNTCA